MILGSAAGFTSIVLSSPMYKTLLLMEVQNSTNGLPQNSGLPQSQFRDQRSGHSDSGEPAAQRWVLAARRRADAIGDRAAGLPPDETFSRACASGFIP